MLDIKLETIYKVVCSDRVCEILKRAQERYYKMYLRHDLTSEFLLFILIEDGESLISQYMYNERLFSCYIREKDLKSKMIYFTVIQSIFSVCSIAFLLLFKNSSNIGTPSKHTKT